MAAQEKNLLVSVIMPTYNRARSLPRAVRSVLAQTYESWELIVADDGSTDTTREVLESLKSGDSRIKILFLGKNQGVSSARNAALKEAQGEYVAFLDSDDEWLPEKLEKQVRFFERENPEVGLVYTGAVFYEKSGATRIKPARIGGSIFLAELAYNPIGAPSRVMIRRRILERAGVFAPLLFALEDWDLWVRISEVCNIAPLDEPLVRYFESEDSLSVDIEKLIRGYERFWHKYSLDTRPRFIKGLHYMRLGHRLCYLGHVSYGRRYLLRSLVVEPWKPARVFLFVLSLLGRKSYKNVTFFIMKNFIQAI